MAGSGELFTNGVEPEQEACGTMAGSGGEGTFRERGRRVGEKRVR